MRGAIVEDFTRANRYFWEKLGVNRYALAGILSILDAIQEAIIIADLNGLY
jgi:hypothetical protein